MKKKFSLLLAALMLLSCLLGACGDEDVAAETGYASKLEDTFFVKDGVSEYVLVLPEQAMSQETFAAEEMTTFVEMATGCTLQTVTENNVNSAKYISLGNTSQFKSAFANADLTAIDGTFSGYIIASKDNNIYIVSSDDYYGYGVLYGVYDLLHDMIGYTYYHDTEIYVEKSADVNLWNYQMHTVSPDFDMRTHSTAYIYTNNLHNTRLRYINFSRGLEWDHTTIGHSQVSMFIAPGDELPDGRMYAEAHPEWFYDPTTIKVTKNNNQLCWTAGGDPESLDLMQTLTAEKMVDYALMNPEATFFMLGQMDTEFVCSCTGCTAAIKEWGGSANGLQIDFVNGVIEKTEALLAEQDPGREILYAVYAYKPTEAPPVKKDDAGNYIPYSDRVIPNEEMRIFFAPIRINYAYPMDAPYNTDCYANLQGWDAVCDKDQLMAYMYDLNVSYYFANFYNFATLGSMYTDLKEAGVSYLLSQGVSDTNTICFDELRAYAISQLMWDTDQQFTDLAADFIDHFYGEAADPMQELFDLISDRYAYYAAVEDPGIGSAIAVLYSTELWPRPLVEQMDKKIQDAMDAIEPLQESDPERYELLKSRIMKEYLSNIYLKVTMYKEFYTDSEIAEMKEIWEYYIAYFNIKKGGEGHDLPQIFG